MKRMALLLVAVATMARQRRRPPRCARPPSRLMSLVQPVQIVVQ